MKCIVKLQHGKTVHTVTLPEDYEAQDAVLFADRLVKVFYQKNFTMSGTVPGYNYNIAAQCGEKVRPLSRNKPAVLYGEEPSYIDSSWPLERQEAIHVENLRRLSEAITATVELVDEHNASVRPPHPEGKTCGDCWLCSPRRGAEALNRVTHWYLEGGVQALREISAEYARQLHAPHLTSENIGECTGRPTLELTSIHAPACEFFKPRPVHVPLDKVQPGEFKIAWNYDERELAEVRGAKS